jgi:RNA 2',3'-cyclic 3'-phosphodiesterase
MPADGLLSGSPRSGAPFFALVPDASAASSLAEIGRKLRLEHGLTGKLLAPEQLHLPLIGLGAHHADPAPGLIDLAMQAAAAISMSSFDVVLDRARSLAGLRRPLVLCGDEGVRGARVLQLAIEIAMHELGIGAAGRRYMPQVTVLDGWRGIEEEAIQPVRWTATEFVLLRSLRRRREPGVLGRWALGKGSGRPSGFAEPAVAIGW